VLPIVLAGSLPATVWAATTWWAPHGPDTRMATAINTLVIQGTLAALTELAVVAWLAASREARGHRSMLIMIHVVVFVAAAIGAAIVLAVLDGDGAVAPAVQSSSVSVK
jgi:hypothetical protein